MAEIRFFFTKILTPEIRLNPRRYFLTVLGGGGGSLKLLTGNGNSPSSLPQNVVPLFYDFPLASLHYMDFVPLINDMTNEQCE